MSEPTIRYANVCSGVEAASLEEWKDIQDYEGVYQVSNKGRVCRIHTYRHRYAYRRILKPRFGNIVYPTIHLCIHAIHRRFTIHRLVAKTFIPNPMGLPQINHKDENPRNNDVSNLEWCTEVYNHRYGTAIERGHRKISCRIIFNGIEYPSIRECARQTGKDRKNIRRNCKCVI